MLPQSKTSGPGHYKYILFAFSGKGGSLPPDGSKQNKTGFSQAAKSSAGWGGRMLGTDPGNWRTCPSEAHSAPGHVCPPPVPWLPPLLPLPALISCSLGTAAPPLPCPLPSDKAVLIIYLKRTVCSPPVKRPFYIHLSSPPPETSTPPSWEMAKSALPATLTITRC